MENSLDNWLSPVPKQSLSKMVVEKIKEGLLSGAIVPGDFLPSETELATCFGVGKSSVREAIKMLEALGVVEICKGNGSKIRTTVDSSMINPLIFQLILQSKNESYSKLLEFRKVSEISGSFLAIDNATSEDFQELSNIHEDMKHQYKKGRSTLKYDIAFHNQIYQSTHNPFVISIGKNVMELIHSSLVISNRDYPKMVIEDHELILKALINQDKIETERVITKSLEQWGKSSLKESLE